MVPPHGSGKRGPVRCIGCKGRIAYGERCPPCAQQVKAEAAKRRRKR